MASRFVRSLCAVGCIVVSAQCGGSDGGPTGMSQPTIQKAAGASGDNQTGTVGAALAAPLRVVVTLGGTPQEGTTVSWAATGTSGTVAPASSVTDASGIATTNWTLGQVAGSQSATASLSGASGSPVTFTASATPGAAAQLNLAAGDNQAGTPGSALPSPLRVKVGDQFGNGVQGVDVAWAVPSGSATVQPASSVTDGGGSAQTSVTLGDDVGQVTVTAESAGLAGSPVTFHAEVAALPMTASVEVGDNFFKSVRNASSNPAVDTVAVGGTVTWTWSGSNSHSVRSTGSTSFTSSAIMTSGTYSFTFDAAGTYTYDCAVHGASMTGTVVVR